MEPLGLTVTQLADLVHVSRKTVSKIVNERGSVESYMALRLAQVFGTSPKFWINLQSNYDLWKALQDESWKMVKPLNVGQSALATR